ARGAHVLAHRNGALREDDARVTAGDELVQRRREAAAGRIAHPTELAAESAQRVRFPVDRRGVALDVELEPEVAAREHDGDAVLRDRPGNEDDVARTHAGGGEVDARV